MKHFVYFIICMLIWLALTVNLQPQNLITGGVVSLITSLIFGRYLTINVFKIINPVRFFWLIIYILFFIWECIKANFDVAYRVIHPMMPIRPGIVKVKMNIKSEFGRTILANSITMTPGTISLDIIDDDLFIHWINVSRSDPETYSNKLSGKFEKLLIKIFD